MAMKPFSRVARRLCAAAALAALAPITAQATCAHTNSLTFQTGVTADWGVCSGTLDMTFTAPVSGWVGIGFSTSASGLPTDAILGWVSGGTPFSIDTNTSTFGQHTLDTVQDHTQLSVTESAGVTTLSFTRPLATGDVTGDFDLSGGQTYFLVAWAGLTDPISPTKVPLESISLVSGSAINVAAVPEPATTAMWLVGLGMIGAAMRRRLR